MNESATISQQKKWYVLSVIPGEEGKIAVLIQERAKTAGASEMFGEIIVPKEEVVELKSGQRKRSERIMFPGYVLINMVLDDTTWHLVRGVREVRRFVGGKDDKPVPLSEKEVDDIFQRVQDGLERPKPKVLFAPGEVVRIVGGPFADFDGVVEDVNYEKNKLKVSVLVFGRSTPVELEFSQVQK